MSLLRVLALACLCQATLPQTDEGYTYYDVSMWQRAPDGMGPPIGKLGDASSTAPSTEVEEAVVDTLEPATNCVCVLTYLCDEDKWLSSAYAAALGSKSEDTGGEWNVQQCSDALMWCCKVPHAEAAAAETEAPPTEQRPITGQCGEQKASLIDGTNLRISFGEETELGEFPWMLALTSVVTMPDGGQVSIFACGASLIHSQVAMTAAHCIVIARKNYPGVQFRVNAGDWDVSSTDEILPHQELDVTKVIMRKGFRKATLVNDIALLVLAHPVQEANNVGTVCLPRPWDQFYGANCLATGWGGGTLDPKGVSFETTLQKVELQITTTETCQDELRKIRRNPNYKLNPSFLCAIGEKGRDTCKGDGGGPLVCPSPHNPDHFVQVGIVSWGIGCGNGTPAVYTDVANQRDWIDNILKEEGFYAESDAK